MDSVIFLLDSKSMAITFLSIICSILIIRILNDKREKKRYHPVGGTIFNQLRNFNRLHDYMTDLARKYKTYRLITPFRSEVYTSDPANVEYILKTKFENYGKGWHNYSILKDLLGDGIFAVDGEKWREQRKVSSHEFSTRVLRDELFMKSTLDSIFKVAFGVNLDTIIGSNEQGARFSHAFDNASEITAWRYFDVLWKIKKALNLGFEAKLKENIRVVDEFVYKLIHANTQCRVNTKKEDILLRFLQLSEADPKYLRDIILNFVMAGKDTTATTLSWFFYMICKNPFMQEKIAQEIKEAMGSNGVANVKEFAASLSEEALDKMHYLHAALTETLRLYPPVPVDPKMCFSDKVLPDGFHVRKGDMVAYQPYAMGRMTFLWGNDAEKFRLERWLDKNNCFKKESPFKFTAFQAGPRICLGKEFAYRQMKILSVVLLRFFIFKLSNEGKAVKYRMMINLHIDGGLSVIAFNRSDDK